MCFEGNYTPIKLDEKLNVNGGYFENTFFSKGDGHTNKSYNYDNNAVFVIKNINLNLSSVRFANTKTIVNSLGKDMISINNCIDNGYLGTFEPEISLCRINQFTQVDIDGYSFSFEDKQLVTKEKDKNFSANLSARNVRMSNGLIK